MWQTFIFDSWLALVLTLKLSHWCHFCPVSMSLNHELWPELMHVGPLCVRCCSGFFCDLLNEASSRFWSKYGRLAAPEKVPYCSVHLRGFITVSRMIDVKDWSCIYYYWAFFISFSLLCFVRWISFEWFLDSTCRPESNQVWVRLLK